MTLAPAPLPVIHEEFCLPRPGETEPRIEVFLAERWSPSGQFVVSRPQVTRCIECGGQRVDG